MKNDVTSKNQTIGARRSFMRPGFTLIELLVAIGIIGPPRPFGVWQRLATRNGGETIDESAF